MSRQAGLSIPGLMVGSFLFALLGVVIFQLGQVYRIQAHAQNARLLGQEQIDFLFHRLDRHLEVTSVEGLHVSTSGQTLSAQPIQSVNLNGVRSWDSRLHIFHYQEDLSLVGHGVLEISNLGLTAQTSVPTPLTNEQLEDAVEQLRQTNRLKPVARSISGFLVESSPPLSVHIAIAFERENGQFKTEQLERERTFYFASSAEL